MGAGGCRNPHKSAQNLQNRPKITMRNNAKTMDLPWSAPRLHPLAETRSQEPVAFEQGTAASIAIIMQKARRGFRPGLPSQSFQIALPSMFSRNTQLDFRIVYAS